MKFVMLTQIAEDGATTPIFVNTANVLAVIAAVDLDGRKPNVSALLTPHSEDRGISVAGSVAEVVAALEAAGAPAVAPVVADDLERVAKLVDWLAAGADAEGSMMSLFEAEKLLIGRMAMDPARAASDLRALAARLRGAR